MAKFKHTVYLEAEQYLEGKNLPEGAFLDGRNNARALSEAKPMVRTPDGAQYISNGDYVAKGPDGTYRVMKQTEFEKVWKPV